MNSDDLFGGDSLIDISVHYKSEKNKAGVSHVSVITEEEFSKLKSDEKTKDKAKVLNTKWVQQTWEAANELLKRATIYNHSTQQQDIDWTAYRHARLVACLVEWDAKDKNGEPVPCTEFTINKLQANVALALLEHYDKATAVDSEEKTKN